MNEDFESGGARTFIQENVVKSSSIKSLCVRVTIMNVVRFLKFEGFVNMVGDTIWMVNKPSRASESQRMCILQGFELISKMCIIVIIMFLQPWQA